MKNSHFGSVLVERKLLSPADYRRIVEKQATDGGALDTVSLELGLGRYLRLKGLATMFSGVPPLERKAINNISTRFKPPFDLEAADHWGVVPFKMDSEFTSVVVKQDTAPEALGTIAESFGISLQPFVGLEFEYEVIRAQVYGIEVAKRFDYLWKKYSTASTVTRRRRSTSPGLPVEKRIGGHLVRNESPEESHKRIANAKTRDEIIAVLTDAARRRFDNTVLFYIVGNRVRVRKVWTAHGESASNNEFAVDNQPLFRLLTKSNATYHGRLMVGGNADPLLREIGSVLPDEVCAFPVVISDRTAAVCLSYNFSEVPMQPFIAPIDSIARHVGERLVEQIAQQKAMANPPLVVYKGEQVGLGEPESPKVDNSKMFEEFSESDPMLAAEMLKELLKYPKECRELLVRNFPGQLWRDDSAAASDLGPLTMLAVCLGTRAEDILLDKMKDRRAQTRLIATKCAAEVQSSSLLSGLSGRLFDEDWKVRHQAASAISGYPDIELEVVRLRLRKEIKSGGLLFAERAADAILELRDYASIPALITALENNPRAMQVRNVLKIFTKQIFEDAGGYRLWWEENGAVSRKEWLIAGLSSEDEMLRHSSIEDLRIATKKRFGYNPNDSLEKRESAIARWSEWLDSKT